MQATMSVLDTLKMHAPLIQPGSVEIQARQRTVDISTFDTCSWRPIELAQTIAKTLLKPRHRVTGAPHRQTATPTKHREISELAATPGSPQRELYKGEHPGDQIVDPILGRQSFLVTSERRMRKLLRQIKNSSLG